jgi:hypothetical protein
MYIPIQVAYASLLECGTAGSPGSDVIVVDEQKYEQQWNDQLYLGESGLDTAYLTHIFLNATNCKTVLISDSYRPWGAGFLKRETGVYPKSDIEHPDSRRFVRRALRVIFAAVTASGIPLEAFELRVGYGRETVSPDMLTLPEVCSNRLPFSTTLTILFLTINHETNGEPDVWARDLTNFIMLFPQLEQLVLDFDSRTDPQAIRAVSKILCLQHLLSLEIAGMDCMEGDLARLLITHKDTLRAIYLDCVGIVGKGSKGSWPSLLCKIRDQLSITCFGMTNCDPDGQRVVVIRYDDGIAVPSEIKVGERLMTIGTPSEAI